MVNTSIQSSFLIDQVVEPEANFKDTLILHSRL